MIENAVALKIYTDKIYQDLSSQSCRTCNFTVSRRRSLTLPFNSTRSWATRSGCGENLFIICRTVPYRASRQSRPSMAILHILHVIRAGTDRSIVATLSRSCPWRSIRSHRRSSISDTTFASGESGSFVRKKRKTAILCNISAEMFHYVFPLSSNV